MIPVYKFVDYKEYLAELIADNRGKRGFITRLAEEAGCQRPYLSQVLHSHVHLTPDHACNLVHFLSLDEWETEYFLTLVDLARAGSPRLQQKLRSKLELIKRQAENFAERLKSPKMTSPEMMALYYSSWHWSAIHMIVSSREYQTPEAIAKRLNLNVDMVLVSLRGLRSMGLVKLEDGRWIFVGGNLHVPKDSPLNAVNHQNWRTRAVLDAQDFSRGGIHYSSVFTISRKDIEELKSKTLAFVDQKRELVGKSGAEELLCFSVDLFEP